jgi:hypothetical protein
MNGGDDEAAEDEKKYTPAEPPDRKMRLKISVPKYFGAASAAPRWNRTTSSAATPLQICKEKSVRVDAPPSCMPLS